MSLARAEFLKGIGEELPILAGVIPFGVIYGVLALSAGLSPFEAQAMSAIVFAGSAQFITAQLYAGLAPALVIILTGAIVNLRHMLYSASMAPYLKGLSLRWKLLLAYLLTDEAYAVAILHQQAGRSAELKLEAPGNHSNNRHWHTLGAGLALWGTWQLSTALGVFMGAQVPESWSLEFTLPLTFIALVIPALRDRPAIAAALAAGLAALAGNNLPFKLGLMLAALVGVGAGMLLEKRA
jgi:4-azaleucine resistance transporter AzlC